MRPKRIGGTDASERESAGGSSGVTTPALPSVSGEASMSLTATPIAESNLLRSYVDVLLTGNRDASRKVVDDALAAGVDAYELLTQLVWPTMELLQSLYREDRISISSLNLATRLNRSLTDQLCAKLTRKPSNNKNVLIFCGDDEPEELGGQICADLF